MIKSFAAKFGPMRKAQSFVTYTRKAASDPVVIQSDKAIGQFDPVTGKGRINFKGCYFVHLSLGAVDFTLPPDILKQAVACGEVNDSGTVTLT